MKGMNFSSYLHHFRFKMDSNSDITVTSVLLDRTSRKLVWVSTPKCVGRLLRNLLSLLEQNLISLNDFQC